LKQQITTARKEIAQKAIDNSKLIYVESAAIAQELINRVWSEHYIICVKQMRASFLENTEKRNSECRSVFIGNYHAPKVQGDYATGTMHTLPTEWLYQNSIAC